MWKNYLALEPLLLGHHRFGTIRGECTDVGGQTAKVFGLGAAQGQHSTDNGFPVFDGNALACEVDVRKDQARIGRVRSDLCLPIAVE